MILHRKNSSVLYANVHTLSLISEYKIKIQKSERQWIMDQKMWLKVHNITLLASHIIYLTCKLKQNLLNCLSKPSKFISCDVKVRKNRIWRMKKQLLTGFRLELAVFGNIGKVSGSGISQFSPLKYTLRGNAHPLLNVNDSESFSRRICVVTDPT